jgi:TonB family protein
MRPLAKAALLLLVVLEPGTALGDGEVKPLPPRRFAVADTLTRKFVGAYDVEGRPGTIVSIYSLGRGQAQLRGEDWEALGWFDDQAFDGVWRKSGAVAAGSSRELGLLHLDAEPGSAITATFRDPEVRTALRRERWTFSAPFGGATPSRAAVRPSPPPPTNVPPGEAKLPAFGEYVYVQELPEAVTKVPPQYPDAAREHHIEGQVLVQALVGQDGLVKDARVVKSIPGLDEAAVAAVRQWRFIPASSEGRPVAVWVAVPVKFSLH